MYFFKCNTVVYTNGIHKKLTYIIYFYNVIRYYLHFWYTYNQAWYIRYGQKCLVDSHMCITYYMKRYFKKTLDSLCNIQYDQGRMKWRNCRLTTKKSDYQLGWPILAKCRQPINTIFILCIENSPNLTY